MSAGAAAGARWGAHRGALLAVRDQEERVVRVVRDQPCYHRRTQP